MQGINNGQNVDISYLHNLFFLYFSVTHTVIYTKKTDIL